ncbi:MAG: SDR family oxidoreductase [Saprospiraceae bacterium]|nr:SDR family oxidoreductase [Saprospiraceae bacterium]
MDVLLTGVTGYIGRRLLPALLLAGHDVTCCVRDRARFDAQAYGSKRLKVVEVDFLDPSSLLSIPDSLDAAYYLIHSMSASTAEFEQMEAQCALNFRDRITKTSVRQVIYLSGIVNESELSPHLRSRLLVEQILSAGNYHLTTLRAGIIVGSGSASFEIIRDLIEKLPIMIAPRWLNTKSQPIAIRNVIQFLSGVLLLDETFDRSYDIGGPEVLTYKEMLYRFASVRKLRRIIIAVPIMTPQLSSYWLYFVTSTSYKLAVNLVDSMKVEVICKPNDLNSMLDIDLMTYEQAVRLAFEKVSNQKVPSSWTDALSAKDLHEGFDQLIEVPTYGCLKDERSIEVADEQAAVHKIWSIGGRNGWYFGHWLWEIRGFIDKLFGGVGLRRGRKNQDSLQPGDALDFWRVLYASADEQRLLLYAEMKLPGEAWLEFEVKNGKIKQTATFRPKGLWGRIYWYMLVPIHHFIFSGMIKKIAR